MEKDNYELKLEKEIKEMEKLAEDFVENKFVFIARKAYGIDAIQNCSNFTLEYDRRVSELRGYRKGKKRNKRSPTKRGEKK